jgi:hypothetical protein
VARSVLFASGLRLRSSQLFLYLCRITAIKLSVKSILVLVSFICSSCNRGHVCWDSLQTLVQSVHTHRTGLIPYKDWNSSSLQSILNSEQRRGHSLSCLFVLLECYVGFVALRTKYTSCLQPLTNQSEDIVFALLTVFVQSFCLVHSELCKTWQLSSQPNCSEHCFTRIKIIKNESNLEYLHNNLILRSKLFSMMSRNDFKIYTFCMLLVV